MDERQRAERQELDLKEVTSNAGAWLLIGANQAGGGERAILLFLFSFFLKISLQLLFWSF